MLTLRSFGDVTQIEMSTRRSRLVGYAVSAYLVRGALVDTGFPRVAGEMQRLVGALRPRGAFVTHEHEDHAGNAELLARLGLPLAMRAATRAVLSRASAIALYRPLIWGRRATLATPTAAFEDEALAVGADAVGALTLPLLAPLVEQQRLAERVAEAHVGEPPLVEVDDERHVVELRPEAAARARDPGRDHQDLEAERAQQGGEQPVEFVAEAAAPVRDDLLEQPLVFEHDGLPGVDAQVLEGDGVKVCDVQGAQGLGRRLKRAAVVDAFEVSLNVQSALASSYGPVTVTGTVLDPQAVLKVTL